MDLRRHRRSGTVHKPDCKRAGQEVVTWKYADGLKKASQLTEVSAQFYWLHLCQYCFEGLCACKACKKKEQVKGESVAPNPSE